MDRLRVDIIHAARGLARRPAYTLAAAGTLALVIGANAAVFAVVSAALLEPVPFVAGDRTVAIYLNPPGAGERRHRNPLHAIDLIRFREWSRTMDRFEAFSLREKVMTGGGEPEVVKGALVTAGLLPFMGAAPALGRAFAPEDDRPGSGVAIISHGLWQRRFGGEAGVVGHRLVLDGEPHVVIGVMPPQFPPPLLDAEIFTPFGLTEAVALAPDAAASTYVVTVAALRDGVGVRQASDEVGAMLKRLARERPRTHTGWTGGVWTVRDWQYGDLSPAALVLMAATAFVLLIACANVANLTLAEALGRRPELSLRLALGASRRDLLRLQATESALVSLAGAGAGLAIAHAAVPALVALHPGAARALGTVTIDWRVQLFTVGLGLLTSVLAGLLPARRALGAGIAAAGPAPSRRTTGSRADGRLRWLLLVAETALSLALLVSGGVLLRSLDRAAAVRPGFDPGQVLTAGVRLPAAVYATEEGRARAVQRILERVRTVPGVVAASTTQNLFQPGFAFQTAFEIEHRPSPDGQLRTSHFRRVGDDYFRTLRIRARAGRPFGPGDVAGAPPVAVISQLFADQHWPGEDPIGRRLRRGGLQAPWTTVVGVVDDVSDVGLGQPPEATLYVPYAQTNSPTTPISLVIRTAGDPTRLVASVRAAVAAVDPELPIHRIGTLESFLSASLAPQRFRAVVLGVLAGLGLLLAALGVYGVTTRGVASRTREFGVRLALGSAPHGVVRLIVGQVLTAVGVGSLAGLGLGAWLAVLLGRVLTDVAQPDAASAVAAAAVLLGTAAVAALVPAARLLRLDPVAALRAD